MKLLLLSLLLKDWWVVETMLTIWVFVCRWEKDQFFKAQKYQEEIQDKQKPDAGMKADEKEREVYKEDAKKLLEGAKPWRPTWKALGLGHYERPLVKS